MTGAALHARLRTVRMMVGLSGLISTVVISTATELHAAGTSCDAVASSLKLSNATITLSQVVAPGAFTPPSGRAGGRGGPGPYATLPAFCRVAATLKPSPGSGHQNGNLVAGHRMERQAAGRR